MNAKSAKLLRGFCKITGQHYRTMKNVYVRMKPQDQEKTNKELARFWEDNEKQGLLDHKKYYDLKKPLAKMDDLD